MNLSASDVADRVAEVLPSIDRESETFIDACERFAALLNVQSLPATHADPAPVDPRAFAGRKGGGVPNMPGAPSDWRGEHTVKRGRNRKGATAKVLAFGDAPVIGRMDADVDGNPLLAAPSMVGDVGSWAWCAARLLVMDAAAPALIDGRPNPHHLRRHRTGWSGIGVGRITDQAAALDPEFPRLLGTEAKGFATIVPGDRSSRSPVAFQRSDLSGLSHHPTLGRFVAPEGGYGAHTTKLAWQARNRITFKVRKSDPGAPVTYRGARIGHAVPAVIEVRQVLEHTITHPLIRNTLRAPICRPGSITVRFPRTVIVTRFVTAADPPLIRTVAADGHTAVKRGAADRLHVGATTIARVQRTDRDRTGKVVNRGAIAARTIGQVPAPDTAAGWAELVDMMNRGERIVAIHDSGRVTITRGKAGQYAVRDQREGREQTFAGVRTATTVAARLAD